MTDLGVATRVHMREEAALILYRYARNIWLYERRTPRAGRTFTVAIAWRSRWSTLREIIDAEERRAVAA